MQAKKRALFWDLLKKILVELYAFLLIPVFIVFFWRIPLVIRIIKKRIILRKVEKQEKVLSEFEKLLGNKKYLLVI